MAAQQRRRNGADHISMFEVLSLEGYTVHGYSVAHVPK